jgi:hypothetical protein
MLIQYFILQSGIAKYKAVYILSLFITFLVFSYVKQRLKKCSCDLFQGTSPEFCRGAEEKHKNPESEQVVSRLGFESRTSWT